MLSQATSSRRGWAITLLTAGGVGAIVLGACWALLAVALPAPAHGAIVATKAMAWVSGSRPVASTVTVGDGAAVHSTCVRHDIRFRDGNVETAALLHQGGSTQLVPVGYPFRAPDGTRVGKPRGVQLARLALAGCPPILESLIGGLIKYRAKPPKVGASTVDGRDAETLRIWTKGGTVTVYLAADSKEPLAVAVKGNSLTGRARLRVLDEARSASAAGGKAA